jgi:hypothetical protein
VSLNKPHIQVFKKWRVEKSLCEFIDILNYMSDISIVNV